MTNKNHEELNFLKIYQSIKRSKFFIIISTSASLIACILHFGLSNPVYKISVDYTINLYSNDDKQICLDEVDCIMDRNVNALIKRLGENWAANRSNLIVHNTTSPLEIAVYESNLAKHNKDITRAIIDSAKKLVNYLDKNSNETMSGGGRAFDHWNHAQSVINLNERGQNAFSFGEINIKRNLSFQLYLFFVVLSFFTSSIISIIYPYQNLKKK